MLLYRKLFAKPERSELTATTREHTHSTIRYRTHFLCLLDLFKITANCKCVTIHMPCYFSFNLFFSFYFVFIHTLRTTAWFARIYDFPLKIFYRTTFVWLRVHKMPFRGALIRVWLLIRPEPLAWGKHFGCRTESGWREIRWTKSMCTSKVSFTAAIAHRSTFSYNRKAFHSGIVRLKRIYSYRRRFVKAWNCFCVETKEKLLNYCQHSQDFLLIKNVDNSAVNLSKLINNLLCFMKQNINIKKLNLMRTA